MEYAVKTMGLTKKYDYTPLSENKHWLDQFTHIAKTKLRWRKDQPTIVANNHVDMEVRKGEYFGLVGPNGAGKTTLIKLLACLIYPDSGTATVNGYDVIKERNEVKKSCEVVISGGWLGFLYQLTVQQNLEFFARLYGLSRETARTRIEEALKILNLTEKKKETPFYLSSGMRQKLLLAKAFLLKTQVLLLDEPTIGLDPRAAQTVRWFVKEKLNREHGVTVIMSTHYMDEADQLCDRIAIMNKGKIVAIDTPTNLKKAVKTQNTVELKVAGTDPGIVEKIRQLDMVEDAKIRMTDPVLGLGYLRIQIKDDREALSEITDLLRTCGVAIRFVRHMEPTLEDVFENYTREGGICQEQGHQAS